MNKKIYILVAVMVIFSVLMTGCEKKLSTSVVPTADKAFPTPLPYNLTEIVLATQAAQNALTPAPEIINQATPVVALATPVVAVATPVVAAATPYTIPTLTRPTSYTLQKGEFPYCIARRYNLDPAGLLAANGLTTASKPSIGFVLKIPATGSWTVSDRTLKAHPAKYTIQSGDTVNSIACLYGDVSPEGIIAANGLTPPYYLTAGDVIQIP